MVNDLTARLKKEPNSADDWLMLARVERTREHFDAANEAFKRSLALSQNADVLIERAEVVALKQKGDFAGEPQQIIDAVLKADPDQANALLLAGSAAGVAQAWRSMPLSGNALRRRAGSLTGSSPTGSRPMASIPDWGRCPMSSSIWTSSLRCRRIP